MANFDALNYQTALARGGPQALDSGQFFRALHPQIQFGYGQPQMQAQAPSAPTPAGTIGGALQFGGLGNGSYQDAYANSLSQNQQMYNNILAGYQQLTQQQKTAQQGIDAGYGKLQAGVMNTIKGFDQAAQTRLTDAYNAQQGASTQGLISSGLGNTTVAANVARGNLNTYGLAQQGLADQFANTTAGYQQSLGMAMLGNRNQAAAQNTGLGTEQLRWMNTVQAQYPQAQQYAQIAQQQGAVQQGMGGGFGGGYGGGGYGGTDMGWNSVLQSRANLARGYTQYDYSML